MPSGRNRIEWIHQHLLCADVSILSESFKDRTETHTNFVTG